MNFLFPATGQEGFSTDNFFSSADWPGTTDTFCINLVALGAGLTDGTVAETVGFTIKSATNNVRAIRHDDCCVRVFGLRFKQTNAGDCYLHDSSNGSFVADRCVFWTADGSVFRPSGGNAANRRSTFTNCVGFSPTGRVFRLNSLTTNPGFLTVEHNTIIGGHATLPTVDLGDSTDAQTWQWNYCAKIAGTGNAYGDSGAGGWAAQARNKNASSDSSGDTGYQSIAYATASGARFLNVTSGSENFDIANGSALRDLATDSAYTVDILGRPRSGNRDVGAFEVPGGLYFGAESGGMSGGMSSMSGGMNA